MCARRKTPLDIHVTAEQQCSVDLRLKILGQLPFFESLTEDDLTKINPFFREVGYLAGDVICHAGDPAERMFVVAEGRVRLVRHSLSGKDILLDILGSGEFFGSPGVPEGEVFMETAVAQTAACVLVIHRADFQNILKHFSGVTMKVLEVMSLRLRAANERVQLLSTLPVEGRIAHVLLGLGEKFGQKNRLGLLIQVPLSRDDLAAMTGTTPESTSRVMSAFQKDHIIKTGRAWVAITNWDGLKAIADPKV